MKKIAVILAGLLAMSFMLVACQSPAADTSPSADPAAPTDSAAPSDAAEPTDAAPSDAAEPTDAAPTDATEPTDAAAVNLTYNTPAGWEKTEPSPGSALLMNTSIPGAMIVIASGPNTNPVDYAAMDASSLDEFAQGLPEGASFSGFNKMQIDGKDAFTFEYAADANGMKVIGNIYVVMAGDNVVTIMGAGAEANKADISTALNDVTGSLKIG